MRYFVTVDSEEFSFVLKQGEGATRAALQPADAAAPLDVELLSRAGTDRAAVVLVEGQVFRVHGHARRGAAAQTETRINGRLVRIGVESELERRSRPARTRPAASGARVCAPMPGRVVKVSVQVGDVVAAGAGLLSIEAMKMENEVQAPCEGRVTRVSIGPGSTVEADQELVSIEPVAAP